MCDCPPASVFTTHETHLSWIIFKECKTENGKDFAFVFYIYIITNPDKIKNKFGHNLLSHVFIFERTDVQLIE